MLSAAQIADYERDGILFPIPVLAADELARYRAAYAKLATSYGGDPKPAQLGQCHLFFPWAYELATHPAVLDAIEDVIGPDILIHSSTIFPKPAHDPGFISWHQDGHYWNLDQPCLVSAWIALTDSHADNGCLRVVPTSHRQRLPHDVRHRPDNLLATGLEIAANVDEKDALDVELEPGEMSLHHVNLIHGSRGNGSNRMRVGFAVRYVSPRAQQRTEHVPVVLARGRDESRHFEHAVPPSSNGEVAVAAHAAFMRVRLERRLAGA